MDDERGADRAPCQADEAAVEGCGRRSEQFVQYVVVWAIRNWARGAAGRVNVHRELEGALSPVAARIACAGLSELMRLLAVASERPILIRPVSCRLASDDEHRIAILCRAIMAGDRDCARRVAAELVRPAAADALIDHAHTILVAIREGSLPAHCGRAAAVASTLTLH